MKYGNYEIIRYDERNLTVTKEVEKTAAQDFFNGEGVKTIAKGEKYMGTVKLGYAQSPLGALRMILKDESLDAMEAETLSEALGRIENAAEGLKNVLTEATGELA